MTLSLRNATFMTLAAFILGGCFWSTPEAIGLRADGSLNPCPDKPNCVASATPAADTLHAIAPLRPADMGKTWDALRQMVRGSERTVITRDDAGYFYAQVTTALMRYVDDVEFVRDDKNGLIHLRSASRVGRKDFGVNRARIEVWRTRLQQQQLLAPAP